MGNSSRAGWAARDPAVCTTGPRKDASWQLPALRRPVHSSSAYAPRRISFGRITEHLEVPNLLAIQTESFDWLVGNEAWADPFG